MCSIGSRIAACRYERWSCTLSVETAVETTGDMWNWKGFSVEITHTFDSGTAADLIKSCAWRGIDDWETAGCWGNSLVMHPAFDGWSRRTMAFFRSSYGVSAERRMMISGSLSQRATTMQLLHGARNWVSILRPYLVQLQCTTKGHKCGSPDWLCYGKKIDRPRLQRRLVFNKPHGNSLYWISVHDLIRANKSDSS